MDHRTFRDAMGRFATGITVVAFEHEGETYAMTVNAFMSISLEPKLIAISIDENASLYDKLMETDEFSVNILKDSQKHYSQYFAKQIESDAGISINHLDDVPVLDESLATIVCQTNDRVKAGDHMIVIAEVNNLQLDDGDPLLFFGGSYETLKKASEAALS